MRKLPRTTLSVLLVLAGTGSLSPALLAQEAPGTGLLSVDAWDVRVRPRIGFFLPRWNYAEDRSLPRRATAGIEVLARPKHLRLGARLLAERTGSWQSGELADWGRNGVAGLAGARPEWVGTVVANAVFFGTRDRDAVPYIFLGGGSRLIRTEEGSGPLRSAGPGEMRAMTLHGGIGFEVRVGGFLAVFEVGDHYGRFLEFGRVHDIHTTLLIGLPGFGDIVETVTTLGGGASEERR